MAVRAALEWLRATRKQRLRPIDWAHCLALKGRRKEWLPVPGETRAARCCVVA